MKWVQGYTLINADFLLEFDISICSFRKFQSELV